MDRDHRPRLRAGRGDGGGHRGARPAGARSGAGPRAGPRRGTGRGARFAPRARRRAPRPGRVGSRPRRSPRRRTSSWWRTPVRCSPPSPWRPPGPPRPSMLPSVADTPEQLTAANVALGWVENAGIALAGLVAGALLAVSDPALTLAVGSALMVTAALLAPASEAGADRRPRTRQSRRSRSRRGARLGHGQRGRRAAAGDADHAVAGHRRPRRAVRRARRRRHGRGGGLGGVPPGVLRRWARSSPAVSAALLVGRRLGVPILLSALVQSVGARCWWRSPGRSSWPHCSWASRVRGRGGARRRPVARCCSGPCRRTS